MRRIIVASHGNFSKGIVHSLEMIAGESIAERVSSYSLYPGEDPHDFVSTFENEMDPDADYVILTDIKGGSVNNAFSILTEKENVWVISGMNLLLLLEIAISSDPDTDSVCKTAIENARNSITLINEEVLVSLDEEF